MLGDAMSIAAVFPWLNRTEYRKIQRLAADLPATFDEWLQGEVKRVKQSEKNGFEVRKVPIIARNYIEWCQRNALPASRASLYAYACRFEANDMI
jgi:hypothetical protein